MGSYPAAKTLFKTSLTEISASDEEGVGNLRFDGQNIYRYVQNKHTALTVGQICFYLDTNTVDFLKKVYDGLTGDLSYMAGVVLAASFTAEYFGWIQVHGINTQVAALATSGDTAIVVGDALIGANGSANAFHGTATGTAPLHVRRIIALEAVATSTTVATAIHGLVQCL